VISKHYCTSIPCPLCNPVWTRPTVPHPDVRSDTIVMTRLVPDGCGGYTEVERVEAIR
jgi:hypothetical protein